jgi:hypothetical protein
MKKLAFALSLALFALGSLMGEERGLTVVVRDLAGEYAQAGKQYAVFIAVDKYKSWVPLKNPVRDAKEIRRILEDRYYLDESIELYDAQATKTGVFRLFQKLIQDTRPEDSVFIFYAGHGQLDGLTQTGFWIPVDAGTDALAQENWIPNIQVRNLISQLKSRHVLLISDSCFSGDILNPTRGAAPTIDKGYFATAYSRVSRQVLTSGASESVPDESEFARQIKLFLEGNARPYVDPLMLFSDIRLGMRGTTPMIGNLKDSGHQENASFLFFLKGKEAPRPEPVVAAAVLAPPTTGFLAVSTGEKGLSLFLNGEARGPVEPSFRAELAPGTYALELKGPGRYAKQDATVEVGLVRRLEIAARDAASIEWELPEGMSFDMKGPGAFAMAIQGKGRLENLEPGSYGGLLRYGEIAAEIKAMKAVKGESLSLSNLPSKLLDELSARRAKAGKPKQGLGFLRYGGIALGALGLVASGAIYTFGLDLMANYNAESNPQRAGDKHEFITDYAKNLNAFLVVSGLGIGSAVWGFSIPSRSPDVDSESIDRQIDELRTLIR